MSGVEGWKTGWLFSFLPFPIKEIPAAKKPRKHPLPAENKSSRGRGRPRKSPLPANVSVVDTSTTSLAGAGGSLKSPPEETITATVIKPSKDSKLGLGISNNEEGALVTRIAPDSLFAGTDLALGMRIETINGSRFSTYKQHIDYLKTAVGQVVIEASYIAPTSWL